MSMSNPNDINPSLLPSPFLPPPPSSSSVGVFLPSSSLSLPLSSSSTHPSLSHPPPPRLGVNLKDCHWFGSEYLTPTGTVTTKKEGGGGNENKEENGVQTTYATYSRPVARAKVSERDRDRDGESSPRVELTPTYVVAPPWPFMGQDDGLGGPLSSGPSFGGWTGNQHDQPVLRFLPGDERIEQYTLAPDQTQTLKPTNTHAAIPTHHTAVRPARPVMSIDDDEPGEDRSSGKPLPPRAGSARSDPKYSPSLLAVTNTWWASCASSHFLVQPTAAPTSPSSTNKLTSPPLLCHTPYVHIRMLMCMALLPPPIFEQRLASLAKMLEHDFYVDSSGSNCDLPSLTLPMFHQSLCEFAALWTHATTVQEYTQFLTNLHQSITEERRVPNDSDNNMRTPNKSGSVTPIDVRSPNSVSSPNSPSMVTESLYVTDYSGSASSSPRPREFKQLPTSVLAALRLAEDEVALERDREREQMALARKKAGNEHGNGSGHGGGTRKKMDRERNEVREAMASKSSEMIHTSSKRQNKTKGSPSASDDGGGSGSVSPKKKRMKEQREDDEEAAAAAAARRQRKKEKRAAAEAEERKRKAAAKQAKKDAALLQSLADADNASGDDTPCASVSGSSSRSAGGQPSTPPSPSSASCIVSDPVVRRLAPPVATPTGGAHCSPRYMSAADIRRSARHTVDSAASTDHSQAPSPTHARGGGGGGVRKELFASSRVPSSIASSHYHRASPLVGRAASVDGDESGSEGAVGTPTGGSGGALTLSDIDRASNAGSRASSAARTRHTEHKQPYEEHSDRDRDRSSSFIPLTPAQLSAAAAKQSRIVALQQQAMMHRARIATGRTHSGHVLPAYIIVDETSTNPQQIITTQDGVNNHHAQYQSMNAAPTKAVLGGYTYSSAPPVRPIVHRSSSSLVSDRDVIQNHLNSSSSLAQLARLHEAALPPSMQSHTMTHNGRARHAAAHNNNSHLTAQPTVAVSVPPPPFAALPGSNPLSPGSFVVGSVSGPTATFFRSKAPAVTPASIGGFASVSGNVSVSGGTPSYGHSLHGPNPSAASAGGLFAMRAGGENRTMQPPPPPPPGALWGPASHISQQSNHPIGGMGLVGRKVI